jgi:hypothetical protein
VGRLVIDLTAGRREFLSLYKNVQIERLIFLSGLAVDADIYRTIAKTGGSADATVWRRNQRSDHFGLERCNGTVSCPAPGSVSPEERLTRGAATNDRYTRWPI